MLGINKLVQFFLQQLNFCCCHWIRNSFFIRIFLIYIKILRILFRVPNTNDNFDDIFDFRANPFNGFLPNNWSWITNTMNDLIDTLNCSFDNCYGISVIYADRFTFLVGNSLEFRSNRKVLFYRIIFKIAN